MDYIVMRLRNAEWEPLTNTEFSIPRNAIPKTVYTSEKAAYTAAQALAETNPGEIFAVFQSSVVYEVQKPELPPVVVKRFNDRGELVVIEE